MVRHPDRMQNTKLLPNDASYKQLRGCNPLGAENTEYVNLYKNEMTAEQAVAKMKLSKTPPTGVEKYQYLQNLSEKEHLSSFKDFLRWFNNKKLVPNLEAMQKIITSYHNKNNEILKLGCTLPNLAKICLHKTTNAKIYPFTERYKDLFRKISEDMVGGPSIVFTSKPVVDKTFFCKLTNPCKSNVGIDRSQLYPSSMC